MNRNQMIVLLVVAVLPFLIYFLRADLVGADSYYFLSFVEGDSSVWAENALVSWIFLQIPPNILIIKLILLLLYTTSVVAISALGHLFDKEQGWTAGIYAAGLAPMLLWEFLKFENDQFAIPLLLIGLLLFYYWKDKKDLKLLVGCLTCFGIAGLLWGGTFYWLVMIALSAVEIVPFVLLILIPNWQRAVGSLIDMVGVTYENMPLIGVAWLGLLIVGFFGMTKKTKYLPQLLFAMLILLINAKFALMAIPFLAFGVVSWLKNKQPQFRETVFLIAIVLAFVWGFLSLGMPPQAYQLDAIELGIQNNLGWQARPLQNDWDFGYWVRYQGMPSENYGSRGTQWDVNEGTIVTRIEMPQCEELGRFYKQDLIQLPFTTPSNLSVGVYRC